MGTTTTDDRSNLNTAIAVIVGNMTAWADFALYAYFSPILAKVFFPFTTQAKAYILYFIVFAVSFFFRPIGSSIAGVYADKHGRKKTLMAVVIIASALTGLIGCLPSYATIGFFSPFLLAILRILQTMSVASEPTNSGSLLIEHASPNRKGLVTSYVMVGIFLGFFLGIVSFLIISYFLTEQQIFAWGWRLPFISFIFLGVLTVILLSTATESPVFLQKQKQHKLAAHPLRDSLLRYPKELLMAFGLSIMMAVANYFLLGSVPDYLINSTHISLFFANLSITISLLISVILIPVSGYLSDIVGRKPIVAAGAIGFAIFSMPIFFLIASGKISLVIIGLAIYGVCLAPVSAVLPAILAEIFPFAVRCTAGSLGYNLALVLFGGTTPIIVKIIVEEYHDLHYPFLYILIVALVHLVFIYYAKETKNVDIEK